MNTIYRQSCIITYFDLTGVRDRAATGEASSIMSDMYQFAIYKIGQGMDNHKHAYVWNDSILLLSYECEQFEKRRAVISEISKFKYALDKRFEKYEDCHSYAISVMGKAFPTDNLPPPACIRGEPRVVVLKTSSWAMANVFIIHDKLKTHKADWYIDSRIDIDLQSPFKTEDVKLLPNNDSRTINMYKDYLHK